MRLLNSAVTILLVTAQLEFLSDCIMTVQLECFAKSVRFIRVFQ